MINENKMSSLSDSALLGELERLSKEENETTVHVLLHLAEVEERKLHVGAGYSTMFSYCTERLRYSEPAASRRLSCARAAKRFPEVIELLRQKELSLSTLSLVSGVLNENNYREVVAGIRGKSRREVEELLAGFHPRKCEVRERIKPVVVKAGPKTREEEPIGGLFVQVAEKALAVVSSASGRTAEGGRQLVDRGQIGVEKEPERYEVRFSISKEQLAQVEEAKRLLSGKYPEGVKLEHVLGEALEAFLEQRSPRQREARRKKRVPSVSSAKKRTRHIPQEVRDEVHVRDGGRCTFVSADGVRCAERHDVEVHHVQAFGRGGGHEVSNLRLLCRAHNVYEAEREYGQANIGPVAKVSAGKSERADVRYLLASTPLKPSKVGTEFP
jgi:5-methylcytosine-specific restriction endonuclease McrA